MGLRRYSTIIAGALAAMMLVATAGFAGASPNNGTDGAGLDAKPFEGVFAGTAHGDNGTEAPLTLQITQQGSEVTAAATLGEGLYVGTRRCGGGNVPAGTADGTGYVDPENPARVTTATSFQVQGLPVQMTLQGDLSDDGQVIEAQTTLGLPALCGGNPMLFGTLDRIE